MPGEIGVPEAMGYDRTIAMFSPDGRLFQVEYAKEAVKRGVTAVGIVFKTGVLLATIKNLDSLMAPASVEKVFQIDDHIASVAAGYLADARVLMEYARIEAQKHRITYQEPIDVWNISKTIGDRMQILTQYGGLRPYGTTILIGGQDKTGNHLIEADPSGMLFEWYAYAIGRGAPIAMKLFREKWKPNMKEEAAIKLAIEALNKTEKIKGKKLDLGLVKDGKFRILSENEIKKYLE